MLVLIAFFAETFADSCAFTLRDAGVKHARMYPCYRGTMIRRYKHKK